ncbi:hypothetical protein [Nonomuraea sp. NPDC048826]|uniref:hypothetical protein n=1 Tax=Nonomuraea sp. NPDC048826 TaxID=3364347 RepID=UPI0037170AAC
MTMFSKRKRQAVRRWVEKLLLNLPASLGIALATPLLGVLVSVTTGPQRHYLVAALCVSAGLVGASAWLRQSQTAEYRDAAQRMARTLSGGGLPVLLDLGRVCGTEPSRANGEVKSLIDNILTTARQMCGYVKKRDEVHAAYYEVVRDKEMLRLRADTRQATGLQSPRMEIGHEGAQDQELVQFVLNPYNTPMQVRRVDDHQRSESFLSVLYIGNCPYRSSVAATVGLGSNGEAKRWGVIVLTSPEKFAFAKADGESLRLMAGVLAAGLAHAHEL